MQRDVICPQCRKIVREDQHACPRCGRVFTPEEKIFLSRRSRRRARLLLAVVLATAVGVAFVFLSPEKDAGPQAPVNIETPDPAGPTGP